jgi:hypothetical protein
LVHPYIKMRVAVEISLFDPDILQGNRATRWMTSQL